MIVFLLIAAGAILLPLAADALSMLGRLRLPPDREGDGREGVVIFVESIRWLSIRWGLRSVAAGFRRAGFGGELLYWRWHATWRGWLVLPAIMDRRMLQREAERLAEFIARRRRDRPGAPIYLVGYSCGGYVALRAMELLPEDIAVDAAALLAPAASPGRDLSGALSHLAGRDATGRLVITSSVLDWFIVGLGTLAFGTADRRHTPAMGMVGPRGRPDAEQDSRVTEIRWRPGLIRLGHLGGHFSASAAGFVHRAIAPAMGIEQTA